MGKRKIFKFERIDDNNSRNITYIKRSKGLMKKAIEVSLLCDQKVFLFMYDESKKRVIHFHSHEDLNLFDIFNSPNDREFYTNSDYSELGGLDNDQFNKLNVQNSKDKSSYEEIK